MPPFPSHPGRGSSRRLAGILALPAEADRRLSTQRSHQPGTSPVHSRPMRRSFRARSAKRRALGSQVERLESRELLSTAPVAHPMFELGPLVQNSSPPSGAYTPAQIQQAYQFNKVSDNGTGETIAIVDAYDDPDIQSDLNTFDTQFGLPSHHDHEGERDRRDDPAGGRFDGRLGARGIARRRVGARHGARGEDPAGRGQHRQLDRPARGRELRGRACERRLDELGRRRVLGRDVVRQRFQPCRRGVRGLLGRQRRPDRVAGRLAERAGRRRDRR